MVPVETTTVTDARDRGAGWWLRAITAAAAGVRAVGGHLTLPLILVVRGPAFLGLLLLRPSEATIAVGAVQARAGRIDWLALVVAAVAGAVLSDLLSYALGRAWGEPALERMVRHRHSGRAGRGLERARARLGRHGWAVVALGRPTLVGHGVVPVLAGVTGMPVGRFAAAATAGAVVWTALWTAGGAVLAAGLRSATPATVVALTLVAAVAVGAALCHRSARCRPQWAA